MYTSGHANDLPRIQGDIFVGENPAEDNQDDDLCVMPQKREDCIGKWIPLRYRLFKYEIFDLLYLALFLTTALFFTFGRKIVVSDSRLGKIPFEFLAWALFMLCILEIALLLVGSWGCLKDRIMKALWACFICAYLAMYSVFRQH